MTGGNRNRRPAGRLRPWFNFDGRTIRSAFLRLRSRRSGVTLLEIVLSLAIFFGSIAVLAQLAWNGVRAGVQARLKTQAIIRCEAKLAEVLSGAQPLQPMARVAFSDNSAWTWSLSVTETPAYPDLMQLDVTVSHGGNNRLGNVQFTLRRWMRDPGIYQKAALLKKESESINGSSSSTSSSSSSTSK